jgi:hypothetical protein
MRNFRESEFFYRLIGHNPSFAILLISRVDRTTHIFPALTGYTVAVKYLYKCHYIRYAQK